MNSSDDFLRPWTTNSIIATLDYVNTGDVIIDAQWARRKKDLVVCLRRRPDVTARMLVGLLFGVHTVSSPSDEKSPRECLGVLRSSIQQTLKQQEPPNEPMVRLGEVVGSAVFAEAFCDGRLPELQRTLDGAWGPSPAGNETSFADDVSRGVSTALSQYASVARLLEAELEKIPPKESDNEPRKLQLKLRSTHDKDDFKLPHYVPLYSSVNPGRVDLLAVPPPTEPRPKPFAARSLKEMRKMAEATVQQSTMLGEKGSVLAPEWAERLVETTASVSWSSASEEEKGKEGTAAPTVDPAPTATAPKTNTIALKDDEQLVYENGEMKVVKNKQQVKRERPDEGDSKKKKPKPDPVAGGRSNGLAMSREELQSMVAEWNISDTLKQVILVGLQPPRTVVQLPDPD